MGHIEDCQNASKNNAGNRAKRKILFRNLAALVSVGLAALAFAQSKPATQFDKGKAWKHLIAQCDFGVRVPMTPGHEKCQTYILDEMKKSCENVHAQDFSYNWKHGKKLVRMSNLIGEQNWKDATTRVVLLAHWDTRPTADQDPDPKFHQNPIVGANDGASGVAVLLELMRSVKDRLPKDVGVMYVMTDGEDLGPGLDDMFLGAKEFVRLMPTPKPTYGILLDMIGDKDLRVPMEPQSIREAPAVMRAFYKHCGTVGLSSTFPIENGPDIEDDHMPLNKAGLPTIDLIDFDYEPWHTMQDVPANCSSDSLEKIGIALETWLLKSPPFTGK